MYFDFGVNGPVIRAIHLKTLQSNSACMHLLKGNTEHFSIAYNFSVLGLFFSDNK